MDLLEHTKQLCKKHNIKPARSKGQNFLIKEDIYDKIIEAADLKSDDVVLEVGPGLGFLTAKLAEKVGRVIAVELDDKLAEVLKTGLKSRNVANVEVVNESILDFKIPHTPLLKGGDREFKIVANIPYNISSLLLRKFLSAENKPSQMVLMLQKEVAERITAKKGEMSLLAVSVQFYSRPGGTEIIQIVPKENFWPAPEVDSAIVKLKVESQKSIKSKVSEKDFFRLVKIGFSAKRKMLKNNLANGYHVKNEIAESWLKEAGFNEKIRAQELSVDDWIKLFGVAGGNML